jgi:hypothetical protein
MHPPCTALGGSLAFVAGPADATRTVRGSKPAR